MSKVLKNWYNKKNLIIKYLLDKYDNEIDFNIDAVTGLEIKDEKMLEEAFKDFQKRNEAEAFLIYLNQCYDSYESHKRIKKSLIIDDDFKFFDFKERKEFLEKLYQETDNEYIRIAINVFVLPAKVWQKLLWVENIDFLSFESFFRRLKSEQINAIEEAIDDLYNKEEVPAVFSRDKLVRKIFSKKLSYEEIVNETYANEEKYISKGALAYDLFNLDFGYGKYPDGVKTDKEDNEKEISKFFDIKAHINDFIVNQTDGIYWWMYKFVRSNPGYRPNREVELSSHICPGFWYTLIMMFTFLFVSPIVFISNFDYYLTFLNLQNPSFLEFLYFLISGVIGLFTPIWFISAIILTAYNKIDLSYKTKDIIEKTFIMFFCLAGLALFTAFLYWVSVGLYQLILILSNYMELYKAVIVTSTLALYFYFLISRKSLYKQIPFFVKALACSVIIYLTTDYLVANPLIFDLTLSMILIAIATLLFSYLFIRLYENKFLNNKKLEESKWNEIVDKLEKIFALISLTMLITISVLVYNKVTSDIFNNFSLSIALMSVIIIALSLYIKIDNLKFYSSPDNFELINSFKSTDSETIKMYTNAKALNKNKYFLSLSEEAKKNFLDSVGRKIHYNLEESVFSFITKWRINKIIISLNSKEKFKLFNDIDYGIDGKLVKFVELINNSYTKNQIEKYFNDSKLTFSEKNPNINKAWESFLHNGLFEGVVRYSRQFVTEVRRTLNACPVVSKQKVI